MKAIILAAGLSTRLKSPLRKTLQPLCGKPVITYITDACRAAGIHDITLIVRAGDEETMALFTDENGIQAGIRFVEQKIQRGTGHAVQAAFSEEVYFSDSDDILVLPGDMPLLDAPFITDMIAYYRREQENTVDGCAAVVCAAHWPENAGFGRIYADENDNFLCNVEPRDLTPEHGPTPLRSTSWYIFNGAALEFGLTQLSDNNAKNEFYLTDVPLHIKNSGQTVKVYRSAAAPALFSSVDTQAQLAESAKHMRCRINERHMANGVKFIDPTVTYIDHGVQIAEQTVIYPGAILEGETVIDTAAYIGPNVHLKNAQISANATIHAHSVLTDARVGAGSQVGPFAYLRPGSEIGEGCRIGNFVEIKNATIGDGSKAAHLAYIGDATVGRNVNYSCGAITANYDGVNKARTIIKDNAFIGSNANLVAPVEIGEWAYVAAGSTINKDMPPNSLGIARARQETKENWEKDPRRQKDTCK